MHLHEHRFPLQAYRALSLAKHRSLARREGDRAPSRSSVNARSDFARYTALARAFGTTVRHPFAAAHSTSSHVADRWWCCRGIRMAYVSMRESREWLNRNGCMLEVHPSNFIALRGYLKDSAG